MTAPTSKNDELVKSWRHFMATRELPTGWEIGDEHAYARETAAKLADALEAARCGGVYYVPGDCEKCGSVLAPKAGFHLAVEPPGYPTEEALRAVEDWHHSKSYSELLDLVAEAWSYPDFVRRREYETCIYWRFATGGWSGNESLIYALQKNTLFWLTCWQSSRRGGAHVFCVRRRK